MSETTTPATTTPATTTPAITTAATTSAATAEGVELVVVDPAALIFAANVRVDARLDAGFVASVREQGVLQPIVAHRDCEGGLVGRCLLGDAGGWPRRSSHS